MRRGWTLHEMLVSLAVTGIVVALAAGAAVGQLRIFRGVGEVAAVRTQVSQAAFVTAAVLRDVGSRRHIIAATDSAIEVAITTGVAFTCRTDTGRIVVPRATASGNTLAAFAESPAAGGAVEIGTNDSSGTVLHARLAADPQPWGCAAFPESAGWSMPLVEPFIIDLGVPVRFTRRVRLSHYRASDGRWYLGYREWNPSQERFNVVQPVAGPLLPRTGGAPGLLLEYRDESGALLTIPAPSQVALVTIIARGDSRRPVRIGGMGSPAAPLLRDSAMVSVAIP